MRRDVEVQVQTLGTLKAHNVRVNRDAGERYVVSVADDKMRGTSIIRGTMFAQRKTRLRFNALLSGDTADR